MLKEFMIVVMLVFYDIDEYTGLGLRPYLERGPWYSDAISQTEGIHIDNVITFRMKSLCGSLSKRKM